MSAEIQRSDAWFSARVGRVTGSRVGAILGDNPWQKREDVLRSMVREYYGAESEFTGNIATRHGTDNEPNALAAYEFETDNVVKEVGLVVHPEHDFLAASPDGLIRDDGCVEFKCPFSGIKKVQPPMHYYHQMQLVMHCTGREWCDYYQWEPDDTMLCRIDRDDGWLREHMATLSAFMDEYTRLTQDDKAAAPLLADKVTQRTDAAWQSAAHEYKRAAWVNKQAQESEKQAKAALIALADNHACEGGGCKATPFQRAGNVDWKSFVADNGLDEGKAENYRKASSTGWRITV